jgi:P pilus assembly chaperone PapD
MITKWQICQFPTKGRHLLTGAVIALVLMIGQVSAGVLVAPTVVFLDEHQKTGRITVQNPSDAPKEITIRMSFGLPSSDSLGNIFVNLQDSGITDNRAATSWVKPFPRRMLLAPGATQVVRFVARPPRDLVEGEYWARVVITSQEGKTTLTEVTGEGQISTVLNMIMQTAIMLKYRKGEQIAHIKLNGVEAAIEDTMVNVVVALSSTGNASYVGLMHCRLFNADKQEIGYRRFDLAVYRDLKRRVTFPVAAYASGVPYSFELYITPNGRKDIAAEFLVKGNDIEYSMTVP